MDMVPSLPTCSAPHSHWRCVTGTTPFTPPPKYSRTPLLPPHHSITTTTPCLAVPPALRHPLSPHSHTHPEPFCLIQITGGRNGYGAKLANIFSTKFTVETCDGRHTLLAPPTPQA